MNALKNKPLKVKKTSPVGTAKDSDANGHAIKLKGITDAERQKLKIPSYTYLLP